VDYCYKVEPGCCNAAFDVETRCAELSKTYDWNPPMPVPVLCSYNPHHETDGKTCVYGGSFPAEIDINIQCSWEGATVLTCCTE